MRQGFTLIELMIVIAIIATIAAIAIPNLLESRITANESAAAASLKSGFSAAQTGFQAGGYSDFDGNGRGEFATDMKYLAGTTAAAACGTTTKALALLPPTYMGVNDGSSVGPYKYQVDTTTCTGTTPGDQTYAESFWAAYAVPNVPDSDGRRGFSISTAGAVFSTKPASSASGTNLTIALLGYTASSATAVANAAPTLSAGTAGTYTIWASNPACSSATWNSTNAAPYQK